MSNKIVLRIKLSERVAFFIKNNTLFFLIILQLLYEIIKNLNEL